MNDLRGNRTPNLRVWNPTRCHCAMKSHLWPAPCGTSLGRMSTRTYTGIAVLAERLRRTLKARVRKSVGSIPTDCIFFFFVLAHGSNKVPGVPAKPQQSAYSSVGRAGDCRWLQLISLGHWFDSGCADNFFFVGAPVGAQRGSRAVHTLTCCSSHAWHTHRGHPRRWALWLPLRGPKTYPRATSGRRHCSPPSRSPRPPPSPHVQQATKRNAFAGN